MAIHTEWLDPTDPNVRKGAYILATWVVVLIVTKLTDRFFDSVDDRLTAYGIPERRLNRLDFLVDVFVVLMGVFVTLFILGVGHALWGAVAVTSIAGVILALAAQQIGQNILAGLVILFERPFIVGDVIELDGRRGKVERVSLASTHMLTPDGLLLVMPNSRVLGAPVTNFTANPHRRLTVTIDVKEAVDLGRVRAIIQEAVRSERHLVEDRPVHVFANASLDEGVRFEVRYWVLRQPYADHCHPSAMARILDALNAAGLATAMPAQQVYVQGAAQPPEEGPQRP